MNDVAQSMSHVQGEIIYSFAHHREKFLHLEYDSEKAIKKRFFWFGGDFNERICKNTGRICHRPSI
jgi:hypothetical protein